MIGPLRRIVEREYYVVSSTPHGGGSVWMTLECGHKMHCKQSAEPKSKARCYSCGSEIERKAAAK